MFNNLKSFIVFKGYGCVCMGDDVWRHVRMLCVGMGLENAFEIGNVLNSMSRALYETMLLRFGKVERVWSDYFGK